MYKGEAFSIDIDPKNSGLEINQTLVAMIHTHGEYTNGNGKTDDKLSNVDIKLSDESGYPVYVATPNGKQYGKRDVFNYMISKGADNEREKKKKKGDNLKFIWNNCIIINCVIFILLLDSC